jgi:beta-lactamase superfamily II metal-dependent hydrolase
MFNIEMLPADHGDCLWITYGAAGRPRHILIDAGTPSTWKRLRPKLVEAVANNGGALRFELFVVSHIDADHIGGAVKLLEEATPLGVTFGDIWFNGYYHLDDKPPPDVLGAKQGEALSALIDGWSLPWNDAFARRAVMVPDRGALPERDIAGMKLTLLSPTFEKLQALKPAWEQEIIKAGLKPGDAFEAVDVETPADVLGGTVEDWADATFVADTTRPNGSSIAFLAEHDGKRALFAADAHVDVLLAGLRRGPLMATTSLELDAYKVSHHGSRRNSDRTIVAALPAMRYLISTNGAQFGHPDPETIARIAVYGPENKTLAFNYETQFNDEWKARTRREPWGLTADYGQGEEGLIVRL